MVKKPGVKTPRKGEEKEWDSDALDGDSEPVIESSDEEAFKRKRKRVEQSPKKARGAKRKKVQAESDGEPDLDQGQEVVGVVVKAPTTGQVPPGQISKNTLNFLAKLKDPKCNDRQWFKLHEPVFRQAEKEWKDFIDQFTDILVEADPQIPHLPAKDVVHRIYRDVRFGNDKTPYKGNFSASFSRSGRKGIFAGYHLSVNPGNESIIAAGLWCPGKNELATIRSNILNDSQPLRDVISSPEFESYFGKAENPPKGERQNIFGREDELKVAPKGIDKDHHDIDLLKCRSFAVIHRFSDKEVLEAGFNERVQEVVSVMRPFVHCLNELLTVGHEE
ncbi:hypothetical protein APHAL10511_005522 [Amanita phalloides]|nr:hypothetical protein APHAL10511_005522 [Amanita phalloides]